MIESKLTVNGKTFENRIVFQPMEGFDCNFDGSPGQFTAERYRAFFASGAGTVWFEANAVVQEGRSNARQMFLHSENSDAFRRLLDELKTISQKESGFVPKTFLQLTHSGRQSIKPMIVYRNELYEKTRPMTDGSVVSDDYLDALPEKYAASARLAEQVGFDGVDIKCCHGYLMQESLSAYNRNGKYGGSFENRSALFLSCVDAVKSAVGRNVLLGSRLGASDVVPRPWGFGTDDSGAVDLRETFLLLKKLSARGVYIVNLTLGNPYYNPYVNRPFRAGPFIPPEKPQQSAERFRDTAKKIKAAFPEITLVQSGLSFFGKQMMDVAESELREGVADLVGFGRQTLANPAFYREWKKNKTLSGNCCVTCSRCSELMRNMQCAGCAVYVPRYKKLYEEKILCKKQQL